jgi:hypothetical protein
MKYLLISNKTSNQWYCPWGFLEHRLMYFGKNVDLLLFHFFSNKTSNQWYCPWGFYEAAEYNCFFSEVLQTLQKIIHVRTDPTPTYVRLIVLDGPKVVLRPNGPTWPSGEARLGGNEGLIHPSSSFSPSFSSSSFLLSSFPSSSLIRNCTRG